MAIATLRVLNWTLLFVAVGCAVSGLLAPREEEAIWGFLTVASFVGTAALWAYRHPHDAGRFLDDLAGLFQTEEPNRDVHKGA